MNVYFTTSGKFYKKHKGLYNKITKLISKLTKNPVYVAMGDLDYEKATEKKIIDAVAMMEKKLKDCDVVITDNTYSISGIGFDIAKAMSQKKPVLVLENEAYKEKKKGPHPLNSLNYSLLTKQRYNEKNLERIIGDFLDKAKNKLDTKFILIIPSEIDHYLEWSSSYKRMHKAQIVRNAIEQHMEKDEDWNEYKSEEI